MNDKCHFLVLLHKGIYYLPLRVRICAAECVSSCFLCFTALKMSHGEMREVQ